jgi:hypothetical protein
LQQQQQQQQKTDRKEMLAEMKADRETDQQQMLAKMEANTKAIREDIKSAQAEMRSIVGAIKDIAKQEG